METIFTNLVTVWSAPKDWSVGGGLAWLAGLTVVTVLFVTLAPFFTARR